LSDEASPGSTSAVTAGHSLPAAGAAPAAAGSTARDATGGASSSFERSLNASKQGRTRRKLRRPPRTGAPTLLGLRPRSPAHTIELCTRGLTVHCSVRDREAAIIVSDLPDVSIAAADNRALIVMEAGDLRIWRSRTQDKAQMQEIEAFIEGAGRGQPIPLRKLQRQPRDARDRRVASDRSSCPRRRRVVV
jgi:hypothetical protein